ncbi:MAG: hypothetical protein WCS42_07630 [Verrucomicrobiota bacterium]
MFVRFGHVLMIVALLAASGAHWAALQSVAWSTMLAKNLHSASLTQALVKTFDGKHPCPLCKAVAAGKAEEEKSDFTLELKKLEYPPAQGRFDLVAPTQFRLLPQSGFSTEALTHEPPVPPPRSRFA